MDIVFGLFERPQAGQEETVSYLEQLMTIEDVADLLRVSVPALRDRIRRGVAPPSYKMGGSIRFRRDEVERFIRDMKPHKPRGRKNGKG